VNFGGLMDKPKIYRMPFSKVYPLYVKKLAKKGYEAIEVNRIIYWLLGYDDQHLNEVLKNQVTIEDFIVNAPSFNPKGYEVKGKICGITIETIEEDTMKKIRILDKLIDERYKGKSLDVLLK
jgi:hypothetical protein